jgi:hypothetical protein
MVLAGMVDFLLVLPVLFVLFSVGYPFEGVDNLKLSSAIVLAVLVVAYTAVRVVFLDSFLLVMDTHAYLSLVPAAVAKARSKVRKK